ncbi:MAG: HAMP domain-containing histidine kinase [Deltaproteobacteria bacterium]|nr:HAMP domain-containing histidine kinase [Deltaproteobacteria bacterium]
MESEKGEIVRQKQLALIGQVLDVYTSSMENHLAAIRESVRWLGDCLQQAAEATKEEREQFTGILSTIERQVGILDRKSQHVDRFAARMDSAFSAFDPGEVVEEVLSFSTRLARVREVSLKPEVAEALPSLYSDPARIHFLLLTLIDDMVERVGSGGEIILRASPVENTVLIEIEGHGATGATDRPSGEGNPHWSIGQQIVADLGGRFETTKIGSDVKRSSLFLPLEQSPASPDV